MARAKRRAAAKRPSARMAVKAKRRPAVPARKRATAAARPARAKAPARRPAAPKKAGRAAAALLPMPAVLVDAKPVADVVEVPARTVLAIDGAGGPEQEPFGRAVGALYGVAYALKLARKAAGGDFKVGPLEGRWWAEGAPAGGGVPPRDAWRWRLRLAVPDDVDEHALADLVQAATMKKGGKLEGSAEARRVLVERISPATMGRVLHVGPYADEERSFGKIREAVAAAGRAPAHVHLEIYLSDPGRTRPEKLRTGLLLELST